MRWAERLADQTAHHYAELRQRRVPIVLAVLMALRFHETLCRSVICDSQFDAVIGDMLAPVATPDDAAPHERG